MEADTFARVRNFEPELFGKYVVAGSLYKRGSGRESWLLMLTDSTLPDEEADFHHYWRIDGKWHEALGSTVGLFTGKQHGIGPVLISVNPEQQNAMFEAIERWKIDSLK